jgi:hypothetical protein
MAQIFAGDRGWKEVWRYTLAAINYRGGCAVILGLGRNPDSTRMTPLLRCVIEHFALMDVWGKASYVIAKRWRAMLNVFVSGRMGSRDDYWNFPDHLEQRFRLVGTFRSYR